MTGEGHIRVNINTAQFASGKGGSIPACAGQPTFCPGVRSIRAVYPRRVRGSR